MPRIFLLADLLIAMLLGIILIPRILYISYKKQLFDMPDYRKQHDGPVPRLGGISFFPAILITMAFTIGLRYILGFNVESEQPILIQFLFLICACAMLYLVGVADDMVNVHFRVKFVVQILAAVLIVASGVWIRDFDGLFGLYQIPSWFGMPFTVLLIVFITNAINLIDGIDGLASGLCLLSLVSLTIFYIIEKQFIFSMLSVATIGIVSVFWCYNVFGNQTNGRKLFMGDTGSLTLGIILSFLIVNLSNMEEFSPEVYSHHYLVIGISTLEVPLLDVIRLVFHRVKRHKSAFLPDRNHIHHKLLRTGLRVRYVMMIIMGIAVLFILMNMFLADYVNINILLVINLVVWTLMQMYISHRVTVREVKMHLAHDLTGSEFPVDNPKDYGKEFDMPF